MKHLSRFQYSMRENTLYRYGSRLSLNIRGSIKFSSDLVAGCTWRATLGTCVFQSDFGFALNCAFKKSGLFRVRNLGGVKGYLGLGEWKRRSFVSISADQSDNRGSFFSRFIRRNLSRIFVLCNVFISFFLFFFLFFFFSTQRSYHVRKIVLRIKSRWRKIEDLGFYLYSFEKKEMLDFILLVFF